MSSAEIDVATHLASRGFGTLGSTIFINERPATPDKLLVVTGYAGSAPDRTHDGSGNDSPSVQIWSRDAANKNAQCRATIQKVYNALDGSANGNLGGNFYAGIFAIQSGATYLGKDENGRPEYVWNFSCIRRR